MNNKFTKNIALVVGCIVGYFILRMIFGSVVNTFLIIGAIGYGMYKFT